MLKSRRNEAIKLYQDSKHKKKRDSRAKAYKIWEEIAKDRLERKQKKSKV